MDQHAIVFTALSKRYGDTLALSDLNLEVARGEVFGFLGPNGAGKTTAIRILLDLIRPTSGRASVLGHDTQAESMAVRRLVGYLPGDLSLYGGMRPGAFLDYVADLRGAPREPPFRSILIDRIRMPSERPISSLSTGERQKVGIVMALMHRPPVLILDEPTSGLDPIMRRTLLRTLAELAAEGTTVFFSSHVLPEVQEVCTRVAILREGRLLDAIDVAEGRRLAPQHVSVTFDTPPPTAAFDGVPGVSLQSQDGPTYRFRIDAGTDALIKRLAQYTVLDLTAQPPSLEDLVLSYYGGAAPAEREDSHAHSR